MFVFFVYNYIDIVWQCYEKNNTECGKILKIIWTCDFFYGKGEPLNIYCVSQQTHIPHYTTCLYIHVVAKFII